MSPSHNGNTLQKITNEGDEQLAKIALGEVRAVHWTSKEGIALEGIVTFPPDYQAGKAISLSWCCRTAGRKPTTRCGFDMFHSRSLPAWVTLCCSRSIAARPDMARDFLNAIYQHFGDRAYRDVDSATDYAIAQGWADPNTPGHVRLERGRLYDLLDRHANQSLQSRD